VLGELNGMTDQDSADVERPAGCSTHQLAYVIYTSGPDGQPQGVAVEHRGLVNLILAQAQAFAVEPSSRVLGFASLSCDACVSEVLVTLSCGASLHLCAREQPLAGEQLLTILRARHISHLTLSPSALNTLPRQQELPDLSTLVVAGESCPAELARRWGRPRRFLNAYGPSEATVCATLYQCGTVDDGNLPIGAPIPNVHIYVLDEHLQPVPVGAVGEIYIGGVGVARGYLNRPELTAQRFLPDPFRAGERMYKSGDFGCWRADANLELAGRQDQQVNLRGYRIELGAIEAVLLQQSAVSEAAVLLREDAGEKLLVAYLTGAATLDLDAIVSN
jgi:amino acid adenylation domain-containing protein